MPRFQRPSRQRYDDGEEYVALSSMKDEDSTELASSSSSMGRVRSAHRGNRRPTTSVMEEDEDEDDEDLIISERMDPRTFSGRRQNGVSVNLFPTGPKWKRYALGVAVVVVFVVAFGLALVMKASDQTADPVAPPAPTATSSASFSSSFSTSVFTSSDVVFPTSSDLPPPTFTSSSLSPASTAEPLVSSSDMSSTAAPLETASPIPSPTSAEDFSSMLATPSSSLNSEMILSTETPAPTTPSVITMSSLPDSSSTTFPAESSSLTSESTISVVATTMTSSTVVATLTPTAAATAAPTIVVKSPGDMSDYRMFMLNNNNRGRQRDSEFTGLPVMLVSDPSVTLGAAAMNVGAGSLDNPDDLLGLAHFVEHMLFMGTGKYPDMNDFGAFVSNHGGSYNAYTSEEQTVYHVSVEQSYLKDALDRFAQFFIDPLFNTSALALEVNNVNSEHLKNLLSDEWRQWELLKQSANPTHPISWFTTGDLNTLGPALNNGSIRERMLDFHNRFYFAANMRLCVVGNSSLDDLEQMVRESFESLPTSQSVPAHLHATLPVPFPINSLPQFFTVRPVLNQASLLVVFIVDSFRFSVQEQPAEYVAQLLGHEGSHSLLQWLRGQQLATSVSTSSQTFSDFGFINVDITLSESAAIDPTAVDKIISGVFDYVRTVVASPSESDYNETQAMRNIRWLYPARQPADEYAVSLVNEMQFNLDPATVLSPPSRFVYNTTFLADFAKSIVPEKSVYLLFADGVQGVEYVHVDPYYGTEYANQSSTELQDRLVAWKMSQTGADFAHPPLNPFIPTAVTMASDANVTSQPIAILSNGDKASVWYRKDISFQVPRAIFQLLLTTDEPFADPMKYVLTQLYLQLVVQTNPALYLGTLAGCDYDASIARAGIIVKVSCYSASLASFASEFVQTVRFGHTRPDFSDTAFLSLLVSQINSSYIDLQRKQAYIQAARIQSESMLKEKFTVQQFLTAIDQISTQDVLHLLIEFIETDLIPSLAPKALLYGNLEIEEAQSFAQNLSQWLVLSTDAKLEVYQWTVANVRTPFTINATNGNPEDQQNATIAVLMSSQTTANLTAVATMRVLSTLMSDPAFDYLRTMKGLGYIVFEHFVEMGDRMAIQIYVEGASPESVVLEMRNFLSLFNASLPEQILTLTLSVVRNLIMKADLQMDQPATRDFEEIIKDTLVFDRREQLAAAVLQVQMADLLSTFDDLCSRLGTIQLYGGGQTVSVAGNPDFFPA